MDRYWGKKKNKVGNGLKCKNSNKFLQRPNISEEDQVAMESNFFLFGFDFPTLFINCRKVKNLT